MPHVVPICDALMTGFFPKDKGPYALTPNTVELIPTLSPQGGPVQDPALTHWPCGGNNHVLPRDGGFAILALATGSAPRSYSCFLETDFLHSYSCFRETLTAKSGSCNYSCFLLTGTLPSLPLSRVLRPRFDASSCFFRIRTFFGVTCNNQSL